jgi:uncharacterized protein (TIGR02466 family)
MPFEYFFPKTFYYRDGLISEEDNQALLAAAHALRQEVPESTRANLYTTYGSLSNVLEREEFQALRQAIIADVVLYLGQIETRDGHSCAISDSWVSISSPGDYERMHIHAGAYVSGVYYIKAAPDCGRLFFENMDDNLWASARTRAENQNSISYAPSERRLLLFNSCVPHHVAQNRSGTERIALSFNVALT